MAVGPVWRFLKNRLFLYLFVQVLDWLEDNWEAHTEEYEDKHHELEGIANPIIEKAYSQGGSGAHDNGDFDDFEDDDFEDDFHDNDEL